MATARLEDSDITAHVSTWHNARTSNKGGSNVGQNATVH
jgi:hypothetical protein